MDFTFPVSEFQDKSNLNGNISLLEAREVEAKLKKYGIKVGQWVLQPEGPNSPRFPICSADGQFVGYGVPEDAPLNFWFQFQVHNSPFLVTETDMRNVQVVARLLALDASRVIPELLQVTNVVGETGAYQDVEQWVAAQPEFQEAIKKIWTR